MYFKIDVIFGLTFELFNKSLTISGFSFSTAIFNAVS